VLTGIGDEGGGPGVAPWRLAEVRRRKILVLESPRRHRDSETTDFVFEFHETNAQLCSVGLHDVATACRAARAALGGGCRRPRGAPAADDDGVRPPAPAAAFNTVVAVDASSFAAARPPVSELLIAESLGRRRRR